MNVIFSNSNRLWTGWWERWCEEYKSSQELSVSNDMEGVNDDERGDGDRQQFSSCSVFDEYLESSIILITEV